MIQGLQKKSPGKKVILLHPLASDPSSSPKFKMWILPYYCHSFPLIMVSFENLRVYQDNISWLMIFVTTYLVTTDHLLLLAYRIIQSCYGDIIFHSKIEMSL